MSLSPFRTRIASSLITAGTLASLLVLAGCAKKIRTMDELSFDELRTKTDTALVAKKDDLAIECLKHMIAQNPDNANIASYKLQLADLLLKTGNLEGAYHVYKQYRTLYPADEKAEYAQYQSILSKFYQTLKIHKDCDTTQTQKTIKLCSKYLDNATNKNYRTDVKDIITTCESRLIDKEAYVIGNYMRQGKFQSAENRIAYLKEKFMAKNKALEPRILYLEYKLAHEQKHPVAAQEKIEALLEKYPESQFTRMAAGIAQKQHTTPHFEF